MYPPTHMAYAPQGTHALVHLSHCVAVELQSRTYGREAAIDDHKLQHSIRTDRRVPKSIPQIHGNRHFSFSFLGARAPEIEQHR
jgi:hypothetical protein